MRTCTAQPVAVADPVEVLMASAPRAQAPPPLGSKDGALRVGLWVQRSLLCKTPRIWPFSPDKYPLVSAWEDALAQLCSCVTPPGDCGVTPLWAARPRSTRPSRKGRRPLARSHGGDLLPRVCPGTEVGKSRWKTGQAPCRQAARMAIGSLARKRKRAGLATVSLDRGPGEGQARPALFDSNAGAEN